MLPQVLRCRAPEAVKALGALPFQFWRLEANAAAQVQSCSPSYVSSPSNYMGAQQYRNYVHGGHDLAYQRQPVHATTILCVRKDGKVVLIGDGQVSMGPTIVKPNARKIRRIGESVVAGFAGSAADGLSLLERLEVKLEEHPGQLLRAAVELAKQWRQDKALRFLQAELLVADESTTLTVSGNGDVLEPHDGVMAIGSGGNFAVAAARALIDIPGMDAATIANKAMKIASDMCVYTNSNFLVEHIPANSKAQAPPAT
eukprot:CAMPEP_0202901474 /NCGR_PEP_ID=MMETSP1392-20130828/14273_1 /ASSEMBLY_ACC=CAM_ASM_000868 /TAXON_ID=225041 /ORGANISM="Chlamydomonas chlamydogama, Strain SAG 11-48b" /LENGTH=256 /DNA_ID=CAMNT_0049588035 /DNA_START=50 /DNA_END=820 /DNA_ORIENTATION=-